VWQQLVIREGTEAYNAWIATPIPVYTRFYLFSMRNPEEFLANQSKPILEEKGPYTFRFVEHFISHIKETLQLLCTDSLVFSQGEFVITVF
jgi:hypothetical protein